MRSPIRPLRTEVPGSPKPADEDLRELLEKLVALADRETLFTMTLERHRLLSALAFSGYAASIFSNIEGQLAPGATITTYMNVVQGYVYLPVEVDIYSSLPWWLSFDMWIDTDLPSLPALTLLRTPDHYKHSFVSLCNLKRFLRFDFTNNHVANNLNYLTLHLFTVVADNTWEMLEKVYLKPISDYIMNKSEELTGRPFP